MKYIKCIKSSAFQTSGNWYELLSDINTKQLEIKAIWGGRIYIVNSIRFDLTDIRNEITVPKQEEYKMKKFQNKQHERLHNALINAGFTDCDGKNLSNLTAGWWNGYINQDLDEYLYFDICMGGDIYIRNISDDCETELYNALVDDIIAHYETLGQTQPITKDNIAEVLKFNNITDISVHADSLGKKHCFSLSMKPDNWLETLEAITGKLKPLPKLEEIELKVGDLVEFNYVYPSAKVIKLFDYINQRIEYEGTCYSGFNLINNGHIESVNGKSGIYKIPEFNFERYLLDNGFKKTTGIYDVIFSVSPHLSIYKSESTPAGEWSCGGVVIQETAQNADILITMANLAKDLK